MRKATKSAVTVAVSVGLATLVPGAVWAHPDSETEGAATLRSTPFADKTYGAGLVGGEAELREEEGLLEVKAEVEGLRPGTTHIGHIHRGTCEHLSPGEIIHNLEPITIGEDGEGESVTVVATTTTTTSLSQVQDCEWWVAFHEGAENTTPQTPAVAVGPVLIEED